jgi:hypothetical protein
VTSPDLVDDRSLRGAIRADWRASSWRARLALVAVMAWLAYEWGPGNESVTPWLVIRVLGDNDGVAAIVWPTLVGFGFTFVQQLISGLTTALGVSMFERTADAAWRRLSDDGHRTFTAWASMRLPTKVAIAFGLGTTAAVVAETALTGTVGVRRHARVVTSSAFLCAAVVGMLALVASGLAAIGRSVPSLEGPTDAVIDVLGNPLFWFVLVTGTLVVGAIRSWLGTRRSAVDGDQQVE